MKKILLINSSPRKNGNSKFMFDIAMDYYSNLGCRVEGIFLPKEELVGCDACGYCKVKDNCHDSDNTVRILQKMKDSDIVIMFCPVYFCGFDAHTKMLIDRSECMYKDNPKRQGKIALVVSYGATLEENYIGMHYGMKYFSMSLEKQYVGVKAFANTDNITDKIKQDYKEQMLQFLQSID